MPQFPTNTFTTDIKQLYLPSTLKQPDGSDTPEELKAWVKLDVGENLVADLEALTDSDKNSVIKRIRVLANRIKEWNYVDANNVPVPINFDNVAHLNPDDIVFLLDAQDKAAAASSAQPLSLDDKKK